METEPTTGWMHSTPGRRAWATLGAAALLALVWARGNRAADPLRPPATVVVAPAEAGYEANYMKDTAAERMQVIAPTPPPVSVRTSSPTRVANWSHLAVGLAEPDVEGRNAAPALAEIDVDLGGADRRAIIAAAEAEELRGRKSFGSAPGIRVRRGGRGTGGCP